MTWRLSEACIGEGDLLYAWNEPVMVIGWMTGRQVKKLCRMKLGIKLIDACMKDDGGWLVYEICQTLRPFSFLDDTVSSQVRLLARANDG